MNSDITIETNTKQALEQAHAIVELIINQSKDSSAQTALCAVNDLLAAAMGSEH